MNYNEDRNHQTTRNVFRIAGVACCGIGAVLILIGVIDFFSAFGTFKQPSLFWCLWIGSPMFVIGIMCLKAGFLGAATAYAADEVTPTVAKSVKYVVGEVGAAIQSTSSEEKSRKNAAQDPAERLKQLEQLKAAGLVSSEEYTLKRREILNAL